MLFSSKTPFYHNFQVIFAAPSHQLNGLETQSFRFGRKNRPRVLDHSVFFEKTLDIFSKLWFNICITLADISSVTAWWRVGFLPTGKGLKA